MYIVDKYTFKINNVVTYHHRGSTCDPAGILILVLLTSNTQSFYAKQFILKLYGSPYLEKGGKKNNKKNKTKMYMSMTHPLRESMKKNY